MGVSGLLFVCLVLVVGREAILAGSPARELRCGRRLVSGLFSRPRLPLGYSYVTTVPRGACRLNVSEIVTTENYIALKILNGSYIMNGEFAVSSPGTYEAAGARFLYTRAGGLDQVFAVGPILEPIDIMILYTQPKPNIKYQYFTESSNDDVEVDASNPEDPEIPPTAPPKHTRRHHNFLDIHRSGGPRYPDLVSMSKELEDNFNENVVGERKFMWKIVSYSQCTRTCGGGIQVGKFRCVESTASAPDREVSSVHCPGPVPGGRRRRCGASPCPPRWRAAAWSPCPECGPAFRKRIVGCVQDHSRGITKISDHKCPPNRPHTSEKCNIPNCDVDINNVRHIEPKRVKPRDHIDSFQEGPVYTVALNHSDNDIGPEYSFSATAGWLFTEWSECVGWCIGEGIQTRSVRCADPAGCAPRVAPESSRSCTPRINCGPQQGEWFVGEWSPCSSNCGGKQVRGVLCVAGGGRRIRDSACKAPKPRQEKDCGTECSPVWYFSDWGKCTGNCSVPNTAVERRSVLCSRGEGSSGGVNDAECSEPRPRDHRPCNLSCQPTDTIPNTLSIESQRGPEYEIVATTTSSPTTTQSAFTKSRIPKDCIDRLSNCQLVVQARLCNYNFYIVNCCDSCIRR